MSVMLFFCIVCVALLMYLLVLGVACLTGSGGVGWCYVCVSCESGFSV